MKVLEKYVVVGGNRLSGTVRISGGKNSVLAILPACLLSKGVCTIHEVPRLRDVFVMKEVLECLGAKVSFTGNTMSVDATMVDTVEVPDRLTRMMRASNLVMGPLLSRFKNVKVAYPGEFALRKEHFLFNRLGILVYFFIVNLL